MGFRPGDPVHVVSLGTGVVREVRGGRCVVDIKGRTLVVPAEQLTHAPIGRTPSVTPLARPGHGVPDDLVRSHAPGVIDLHGMSVLEAVAALDAFVNDAVLAGLGELRVIHGRSGGRLKAAVHGELKRLPVRGFRLDPSNPGVTIVTL